MKGYLCIDIGGTTIKSGVFNTDGNILEKFPLLKTNNADESLNIVNSVKYLIKKSRDQYSVQGVCISTAGVVDPNEGEVVYAGYTIPNYSNTPLKKMVEKEFNIPCEVENDVNAACLGELWKGSLRNIANGICLTVGTGIGGSILINSKIQHGVGFTAGEVGYLKVNGSNYQDIASTTFLVEQVSRRLDKKITGKEIFDLAISGDQVCIEEIDKMITNLSIGLVNMMYLLNPEVIVLGGGIMAQEAYISPLIKKKVSMLIEADRFNKTKIQFATLKNDAGMIGALYNFKKRHR
ncbi:ROK family protein [uncultured Vagococcus sp.]|uniref:ROK family protein n=1 Tax=uncultured Vagococcus sp. TaxID=189676 RepID=UPI0025905760|nr:ROK family protein [uncultured Vagococcus sp.]